MVRSLVHKVRAFLPDTLAYPFYGMLGSPLTATLVWVELDWLGVSLLQFAGARSLGWVKWLSGKFVGTLTSFLQTLLTVHLGQRWGSLVAHTLAPWLYQFGFFTACALVFGMKTEHIAILQALFLLKSTAMAVVYMFVRKWANTVIHGLCERIYRAVGD